MIKIDSEQPPPGFGRGLKPGLERFRVLIHVAATPLGSSASSATPQKLAGLMTRSREATSE